MTHHLKPTVAAKKRATPRVSAPAVPSWPSYQGTSQLVGTAGAVGLTTQREDDDADRAALRPEDSIILDDDAIGIVDQVLPVLKAGLAERRAPSENSLDAIAGLRVSSLSAALLGLSAATRRSLLPRRQPVCAF